ncbi:MAG: DUF2752 domain-containing protein [Flavisolibacter sp.]|nr:DUF2752 domain-containing protein [Flavisolibacter sp.]
MKKLLLITTIVALLLIYFFFDARKGGFPECPFHLLTGWFCPGCGSQRALSSLLHGNVVEAMHNNILMVLFLPLLLYSAFVHLRYDGARRMKLWYNPFFVKIVLAAVVCFWIFRNIPHRPFSILAPLN